MQYISHQYKRWFNTPLSHWGLAGLTCTFFLGCATAPEKNVKALAIQSPQVVKVDDRPFEMDTLYALMAAEMAGDRHRFDVMLNNYVQQAEVTHDLAVVARATRLARYLNVHATALDMALLWADLEPNNAEARYVAAAELVHANRLLDAMTHAKFLLKNDEVNGLDAIGVRAQQGGDIKTTQKLISEFQPLLEQYPNDQALLVGVSLLYQHAGNLEFSLTYIKRAIVISPDDFQAKAQETRILQQLGRTEEALGKLGNLVDLHPENSQLRLQYARGLLKSDLTNAQTQFEELLKTDPSNIDLTLTLALIEYERGFLNKARKHFVELTEGPRHQSTAYYYLGQIDLTHQNADQALHHFKQVKSGPNRLPALSRICDILVMQNKAQEAVTLIQKQRDDIPKKHSKQIQALYLLESHILTGQGQYLEALSLLERGVKDFPSSSKLIYTRAMLFTRMDKIDDAERDLKRVLSLAPENAAALNALGYTLADRTERLDEAYEYIQRAYKLTPNDPAVMDSLGWVEYRRGNHKAALQKLRSAMKAMPDHEIAAHLGEVLWMTGQQKEANKVWRNGLQLTPKSDIIHNTMQRLQATPL